MASMEVVDTCPMSVEEAEETHATCIWVRQTMQGRNTSQDTSGHIYIYRYI